MPFPVKNIAGTTEFLNMIKSWVNDTLESMKELLNKKADKTHTHTFPYITSQGSNTNGHYRVWSNGDIEQWGTGTSNGKTRSLPISFNNTNYIVLVTPQAYGRGESFGTKNRSKTSFAICCGWTCDGDDVEGNEPQAVFWYARSM